MLAIDRPLTLGRGLVGVIVVSLGLIAVLATWVSPSFASNAPSRVQRFAVIVGASGLQNDLPLKSKPLHFSDDDALGMWELMTAAGVETEIFTVADPDTASRYPQYEERFKNNWPPPASKENVEPAVLRLIERATAVKRTGGRADLIFYFSGHATREALFLNGGRLTPSELVKDLLRPAQPIAFHVHLLIDACGVGDLRDTDGFAEQLRLDENVNVGVVFGSTAEGFTLESRDLRAGVLSFLMRSAFWGASDLGPSHDNKASDLLRRGQARPDGAVGYLEIGAYIATATNQVKERAARIFPVQHLPRWQDPPIVDWTSADANAPCDMISIPSDRESWIRVLDAELVRLVEVHRGPDPSKASATFVHLPHRNKYYVYVLDPVQRSVVDLRAWVPGSGGTCRVLDLANLQQLNASVDDAKGEISTANLDQALKEGLFLKPYNQTALAEYEPAKYSDSLDYMDFDKGIPPDPRRSEPPPPSPWIGLSCNAALVGTGLTALAFAAAEVSWLNWKSAPNEVEYQDRRDETYFFRTATTVSLGVTGGLGAICLGGHLWPRSSVVVGLGPRAATALFRF